MCYCPTCCIVLRKSSTVGMDMHECVILRLPASARPLLISSLRRKMVFRPARRRRGRWRRVPCRTERPGHGTFEEASTCSTGLYCASLRLNRVVAVACGAAWGFEKLHACPAHHKTNQASTKSRKGNGRPSLGGSCASWRVDGTHKLSSRAANSTVLFMLVCRPWPSQPPLMTTSPLQMP